MTDALGVAVNALGVLMMASVSIGFWVLSWTVYRVTACDDGVTGPLLRFFVWFLALAGFGPLCALYSWTIGAAQ